VQSIERREKRQKANQWLSRGKSDVLFSCPFCFVIGEELRAPPGRDRDITGAGAHSAIGRHSTSCVGLPLMEHVRPIMHFPTPQFMSSTTEIYWEISSTFEHVKSTVVQFGPLQYCFFSCGPRFWLRLYGLD